MPAGLRHGPILDLSCHHAQHFIPGSGFAGPDFELSRRLMHEHLDAGDHFRARGPRHLQQARFRRIVDHVEDIACFDLVLIQRRFAGVAHAHRRRVDNHIEREFLQVRAFESSRPRRVRQLSRLRQRAIQNVNFCATFLEPIHRGPRRSAGP